VELKLSKSWKGYLLPHDNLKNKSVNLYNNYSDEITVDLIKAASEVSGLSMETVMIEYGKFMVPNILKEQYPTYFQLLGRSPREFLLNMDRVHEHVTRNILKSTPPRFEYEQLSDGRLLIKYKSKRKLCAVLHGLILGVGILFNQELDVHQTACMHKGDAQCVMEITFP
jgi:predicted hydrocarbon binding protein